LLADVLAETDVREKRSHQGKKRGPLPENPPVHSASSFVRKLLNTRWRNPVGF
jgi:hypothetical protein